MGTYTTEIASDKISSDNPIHQRLLKAYYEAEPYIHGVVFEPGCGEGRGLKLLASKAEKYIAADKIIHVIDKLRSEHTEIEFIQMHFPPFEKVEPDSVDVVITFQVIEHVKDDKSFLQEIHRILKPGGKAIITTPNIKMTLTRNPWHEREYTSKELSELASEYFSEVEMKGIAGNKKVMDYYEKNKASVRKITRFDFLNLQYRLPSSLLRIPYDVLNRMNRNNLQKDNDSLVTQITIDDYYLNEESDTNLDLFCIVTK